jgi:hypothetical protein
MVNGGNGQRLSLRQIDASIDVDASARSEAEHGGGCRSVNPKRETGRNR